MKRCLSSDGILSPATKNSNDDAHPPMKCTKCHKVVTPIAEFHKHILECGGDTTWMSTMFASSSLKKHKYVLDFLYAFVTIVICIIASM